MSGFGHYRFVVKDAAGNEKVEEFIIMPVDNIFTMVDNTKLNDVNGEGNVAEEEKQFDYVVLQKISTNGNSFYFEEMRIIGDKDALYLLGVVPDKEGAVFSIYASGAVQGSAFKQFESSFPINISTNINNINPEYKINDYIINYKGEKYILVGVEVNGYTGGEVPKDEEIEEVKNKKGNFTWIFFVLGGVGAVGGVFLVMKLRKRVRAA